MLAPYPPMAALCAMAYRPPAGTVLNQLMTDAAAEPGFVGSMYDQLCRKQESAASLIAGEGMDVTTHQQQVHQRRVRLH